MTPSKLMQAAVESLDTDLDANQVVPETNIEDGDALFAEAETLDVAVEALVDKLISLENISLAIESVDYKAATPALARVVQAAIYSPFEQGISLEAYTQPFIDPTIDDVVDKSGVDGTGHTAGANGDKVKESGWQNLKGRTAAAAKAVAKAVVDALKAVVNFLKSIFDWAFGSTTSLLKKLKNQKTEIAKAKNSVEIKYNRNFKSIIFDDRFNPVSAKQCLAEYMRVTTSSTGVIADVVNYTNLFKPGDTRTDVAALNDMFGRFSNKVGLKSVNGEVYKVYEGPGQSALFVEKNGDSIRGERKDIGKGEPSITSFEFSKNDVTDLTDAAIALLFNVSRCNEAVKKAQSSLNRLMALWAGNFGQIEMTGLQDKSVIHVISKMRAYLAFTTKYGIGTSIHAAKATSKLVDAYTAA